MNRGLLAAGGALAASFAVALAVDSTPVIVAPKAPLKVEVVGQYCNPATNKCDVQVSYGPRQPGKFIPGVASPDGRSLVIMWEPSDDALYGPVTYTLSKNGTIILRNVSRTYAKVGFTLSVRSFKTCVWAKNTKGQASPKTCATWTGGAPSG